MGSAARDQLLDAAVSQALHRGIVDLSLREIAAAVGTSHRMLIYHFGSRQGLIVAVVQEVERRERATSGGTSPSPTDARRQWERLSDPSLRGQERLFFEIYAHALLGRPGTEGFLDDTVEAWIAPIAEALATAGTEPAAARALARLSLAVTRGLLLDLLATSDREGTTRAFSLFASMLERLGPPPGGTGS